MDKITIDLKVPRGWAQCSTRELEMIAEEMMRSQMMATMSKFHPFDWTEVKTRLFFRFAGVEVIGQSGGQAHGVEPSESVPSMTARCRKGGVEFELQTWQVQSFVAQHLAWIDAVDAKGRPKPMPKLMWPYPKRIRRWWPLWRREYYAPGELMDGMTWQQYRWINDWMEAYTQTANQLVAARGRSRRQSRGQAPGAESRESVPMTAQLARQEQDIRTTVLSLMFGCPKWRIRMARISETEWQVVMFWWSSMMQYLKEQYPKCFKSSAKPSRSKQQALPIELYTRSMATLQKYLGGLTETEINEQTAHAILRHLNDMAVEAEEMEKLKRKRK